ncbi:hypothetical protein K438DRAFT_1841762 [Mycena galopus ATCC 62051]|nr:hypothetical protein K438DRAFT_1841762 [Mycena galopus ATCC 62051]
MVKFTIYTGGYTTFIVSYLFGTQSASLTYLDTIPTTPNCSWITPHLTSPNLIYAVNEVAPLGALQVYETIPGGGLTLLDEVTSGGDGPTFCAPLTTGQVAIMNYGSGNGEIIPTVNGGTKFDNSTTVLHGNEVFVPDLPLGSGPRHMRVLEIPPYPNGTSPFVANATTVPADVPPGGDYAAAELLLSTSTAAYPKPCLYASNRNIGGTPDPRGDSVAIFDPAGLRLVNQVFTGLVEIRGMNLGLGDTGEEYLVALGAVSGGMVVYKRTAGSTDLVEVARNSSAVPRTSLMMREVAL